MGKDRKLFGCKVLLHFDEVKDIDANLSAALGAILDSATKKGTSMFLNAPREKNCEKSFSAHRVSWCFFCTN